MSVSAPLPRAPVSRVSVAPVNWPDGMFDRRLMDRLPAIDAQIAREDYRIFVGLA